jgi:hypothetical protein
MRALFPNLNSNNLIQLPGVDISYRPNWQRQAACLGAPKGMFHEAVRAKECLAVCHRCPVIDICLEWIDDIEKDERDKRCIVGVYGGETPKQRIERRNNVN